MGWFLVSLSLALSSLRYAPYLLVFLGGILIFLVTATAIVAVEYCSSWYSAILGDILDDILGGILIFLVTDTATTAVEYRSCSMVLGLSVW
jgi:hypothetical protein